jgi:hypothetical protein
MRKPKSVFLIRHASRATFSKGEGKGAGERKGVALANAE